MSRASKLVKNGFNAYQISYIQTNYPNVGSDKASFFFKTFLIF